MYYDDLDYASKRLRGTLVRTKQGIPILIHTVSLSDNNVMYCTIESMVTGDMSEIRLCDIDLTPVPLGYVNLSPTFCAFTCRKPMRVDYKQGLSRTSFVSYETAASNIPFKSLLKTIMNEYPSYHKCLKVLESSKDQLSQAFSRDFSLVKEDEFFVNYRGKRVGKVVRGIIILNNNKKFLQEHLDEVVNR